MTTERDFDRLARAWLELGPDEAPDRVVAAVLQAAETTPQVRRRTGWSIWRSFHMTRLPIVATVVAALVVVLGGGILLSRAGNQSVGAPESSPSAVPSTGAGQLLAASIRASSWIHRPEDPSTHPDSAPLIRFGVSSIGKPYDTEPTPVDSDVVVTGANTFEARSTTSSAGCAAGDVGRYTWSVSPTGNTLTLTGTDDACKARSDAMPSGSWARIDCTIIDNGCYGDLDAGAFASQYVDPRRPADVAWEPDFGAMAFEVPDGWANSKDDADTFTLTPSAEYALESANGPDAVWHDVTMYVAPAANRQTADCARSVDPSVGGSIGDLATYVKGLPSLTTSDAQDITVGGRAARGLYVEVARSWTAACPDLPGTPATVFLTRAGANDDAWTFGVRSTERALLVFVDIGQGNTVVFIVDSTYRSRFQTLANDAMPIIESFTFR
jgi:hypothetical protein